MKQLMKTICKERPVGTANNTMINAYLEEQLNYLGLDVQSLSFECMVWESAISKLQTENETFDILPSPFSEGFVGEGKLVFADTLSTLAQLDCTGDILLLSGDLTQTPLQPKNYPFYFPDEHKQLISILEQKSPTAILALTGSHPLCGLSPFPLFEDGNFKIPSAYLGLSSLKLLTNYVGTTVYLSIVSSNNQRNSRQLIATKHGKNKTKKIVICAHMDSKYNTPGALDNAAGVAVLIETAKRLIYTEHSIDIVPFNGEEYYGASGELEYLQYLKDRGETVKLLINIDSPCHIGAETAVSFYNFTGASKEVATKLFDKYDTVGEGQPWYAGDHCAFAFGGTPCVAVTSSDLFDGGLANTHTPKDTIDCIDTGLIVPIAEYIATLVHTIDKG